MSFPKTIIPTLLLPHDYGLANVHLYVCRSMREKVKDEIAEIQKHNPRFKPGLAIVQVGDRPDSTTYVRMKGKAAQEVPPSLLLLHCMIGA